MSTATRYALGAAVMVLFLLLRLALAPLLGLSGPYLQFFPAIMLTAYACGLGPGLMAVAFATVAADFFFLEPTRSFAIAHTADRISLPLFSAIGISIVWAVVSARRAQEGYRAAAADAERRAEELEAVFEAIPDGVFVGSTERFTKVNRAGLALLGIDSLEQISGGAQGLAQRLGVRSANSGEPVADSHLLFVRALAGERAVAEQIWTRPGSGEPRFIRGSAAPIRTGSRVTGAVVVAADITDQRRMAQRLDAASTAIAQANERLAQLVASVPGVVWEAWGEPDSDRQRIDYVSEHIRQMMGYEPAEWTATPNFWLSVVHPDDRQRAGDEARAIFESRTAGRNEFRWVRRDGSVVWVEAHSSVILDDAGAPVGMRGVTLDISHRKRLEQERTALLDRTDRMRAEAEEANRLKDVFLATLSHELRTPLNAILGYARMLRTDAIEPDRRARALEIVERNANALTQMVADILDVSRVITGKLRLNVQVVDLPVILQEAVATVQPAIDAKGLRLDVVADPGAGPVSGDPDRLQQVVWNLLSNAIRFTPTGGRIQVRLLRVNSHVEIVVSDTGIGVVPEFLPHIFERFRQADDRPSREHGGLGLGLAIVRQLVELHGGTIAAFSEGLNRGATFRIALPIMAAHSPDQTDRVHPTARTHTTASSADLRLDGIRILAVDDDEDARTLLRDVLERAGAEVMTAGGADAALQLLGTSVPDVVITDLGMPVTDGFGLLSAIRARPETFAGTLPVVALTAYARSDDRTRCLRAGFQMHLAKPIDPNELIAAVYGLAGRNRSRSSR